MENEQSLGHLAVLSEVRSVLHFIVVPAFNCGLATNSAPQKSSL